MRCSPGSTSSRPHLPRNPLRTRDLPRSLNLLRNPNLRRSLNLPRNPNLRRSPNLPRNPRPGWFSPRQVSGRIPPGRSSRCARRSPARRCRGLPVSDRIGLPARHHLRPRHRGRPSGSE